MFRVHQEWSDGFGRLQMVQECCKWFRNAADGFGNAIDGSGRPGMG